MRGINFLGLMNTSGAIRLSEGTMFHFLDPFSVLCLAFSQVIRYTQSSSQIMLHNASRTLRYLHRAFVTRAHPPRATVRTSITLRRSIQSGSSLGSSAGTTGHTHARPSNIFLYLKNRPRFYFQNIANLTTRLRLSIRRMVLKVQQLGPR